MQGTGREEKRGRNVESPSLEGAKSNGDGTKREVAEVGRPEEAITSSGMWGNNKQIDVFKSDSEVGRV